MATLFFPFFRVRCQWQSFLSGALLKGFMALGQPKPVAESLRGLVFKKLSYLYLLTSC